MTEKIHTHKDADLRMEMCQCSNCKVVAQCTPAFDFYGDDGEPLLCEPCMLANAGIKKPLMHMVRTGENTGEIVSKEEFVKVVEDNEKKGPQ